MASSSVFSLSLCFAVFFHGCFARIDLVTNRHQGHQQEQPQQQYSQNQCQLQNLNVLRPQHHFRSEAGETEFWDQNEQQFQCAGVAFLRHTIHQKGLLLPSFNNAPQLFYVVEGEGIHEAVFPSCPETYQTPLHQSHFREEREPQSFQQDQHQKLRRIREGDVVALPAGVAHWIYNNGQSRLVVVSLVDVANYANQLDKNFRKFFLAGNPQEGLVTGGQGQSHRQSREHGQGRRSEEQQESSGNNFFAGFDTKQIAQIFRIDERLARKLQGENDQRGAIVRMENEFQLTIPEEVEEQQSRSQRQSEEEERERYHEEERERERMRGRGSPNGLEETFCTMKLKHRTDSSYADVFNPRAGRLTSVNSFNLPILQFLQLSAERGVLYQNALYAPHWNINAHSIVYITRGSGRMQIVSESGDSIFDDNVEEGQVITVPQHYAVLKKASKRGFEWIAFKTNANAKVSPIAGRASVFRGLPAAVLSSAFKISNEEATRLKQNRQELKLFSPFQEPRQ